MSEALPAGSPTSTPNLTGRRPRRAAVTVALLAVAAVGVSLIATGGGSSDWPTAGSVSVDYAPAPAFSVPGLPDGTVTLNNYLGTPVVLNLWASWCEPCRSEMPALDQVASNHPEIAFVGIAVQDVEPVARRLAEELGVTYRLGFDTGRVLETYPVVGLPTTWFIDAEGVVMGQVLGEMGASDIEGYVGEFLGS